MKIDTVSGDGFHIVAVPGDLTINVFSSLTPAVSSIINEHPDNDLVLDISRVTFIDASAVRLLLNINKKLETARRKLYLLNPGGDRRLQLSSMLAGTGIAIIGNLTDLQRNVNSDTYQQYLPFTFPEENYLRLHSTCGVCGSGNVFGYLLEQNNYIWSWSGDDYFPLCLLKSGEPFDYFSALPVVCADCLTASIDIAKFNLVDADGAIRYHGTFNDQTKQSLSKTYKKRKKLLEEAETVVDDFFFQCPRSRISSLFCCLLAESCARIAIVNHHEESTFSAGYLNYLALSFADRARKPALIDDCRTWLTQTLLTPERWNHAQLAQSHFIIFVAALSLGKYKDAGKIMESFSALMNRIGSIADASGNLNSPCFWFNRADDIWKKEVPNKPSAIIVQQ